MSICKKGFVIAFVVVLMFSCGSRARTDDPVVARVGDKRLYFSEMSDIFPIGISQEDSLRFARLYVDNWIKTRLLLRRAELNLTAEELDVSRELETYRTSLLIHKYEDRMLHEKLDTVVRESEIRSYYEANIANFASREYAVRAVFVKLPENAPELWNFRRWLASTREDDMQALTEYCRRHAVMFSFFDNEWILWENIERELPQPEAARRQMRQNGRIEQRDDRYIYFVHVRERRAPGEPAPLVFVTDRVKSIIINKRKLAFLSELRRNIYNDALERNQFEIFNIN